MQIPNIWYVLVPNTQTSVCFTLEFFMYKLTVTESHPQYLWTLQELHRKTMVSKEREGNQCCSVNNTAIADINCLGQFIYLLSQACMGTLRMLRQIN